MKTIDMRSGLLILLILFGSKLFAQSPQRINYQGVARNSSGNIVTTPIGIKFQIYQGSVGGTLVYEETNTATPSSAGVFTVQIGGGVTTSGTFSVIAWGSGSYFLQVNIDPAGGTSYSTVGASQLVSVPYSLFAEKAGNVINYNAGNGISISSGSIINTAPNQTVNISGSGVTGSYPNYSITTSGSTYTAGSGIAVGSGTITNTAPDLTVTLTPSTNVNVNGTYPNFTVSSTPSLSISGNSLSISGGNGVLIPSTGTFIATPNTSLTSTGYATITPAGTNTFNIAVPPQTLNLVGNTISISYGNSITLPVPPASTITGGGIAVVSPTTGAMMNVSVPPVGMSYLPGTGVLTYSPAPGSNTINLTPALSFTNNVLGIGSNTIIIPGSNLWSRSTFTATTLSNISDNVGIGTTNPNQKLDVIGYLRVGAGPTSADEGWLLYTPSPGLSILRAGGRATTDMRLDQNNNAPMTFWTNGFERMRITPTGNVGIGMASPTNKLEVFSTAADIANFTSTAATDNRILISNSSGLKGTIGFTSFNNSFQLSSYANDDVSFGVNNLSTVVMTLKTTGNVGIGTSTPASKLHVNGGVTVTDGTQGADKVLTSNATGNASWQNSSRNTAFSAFSTVSQIINLSSWTQINFGGEKFDDGNDFATNQYVAPTAGVYQFNASIAWSPMTNSTGYTFIAIYVNGVAVNYKMAASATNYHSNDIMATVKLNAGDIVTVWTNNFGTGGTANTYVALNAYTYFQGYRIY